VAISYHPDTIEVDAYRDARRRLEGKQFSASAQFKRTYRDDRLAFIHDCVEFPSRQGLTRYQEEAVAALEKYYRVAIRSPRGGGKSALASLLVHHYLLTREKDETKVPTTASSWQQLINFLWPEIHKWAGQIRWDKVGRDQYTRDELLGQSIKLSSTCRAFSMASDKPANMEGGHGECMFVLFDESKTIPVPTWDSMEGTFSRPGERYFLAVSTPGPPTGRFYDIHQKKPGFEDWHAIHWTMEDLIGAGMMDPAWAEQRLKHWGENSSVYQRDVLGNFAADEESSLIPLDWVEAANLRWQKWLDAGGVIPADGICTVGVDPAGEGKDDTVICPKYGDLVPELVRYKGKELMAATGQVVAMIKQAEGGNGRKVYPMVEINGLGTGMVSRLREQEYPVIPVNVSRKSKATDRHGYWKMADVRTQLAWAVREWLDPANDSEAMLPPDDKLTGDIMAQGYDMLSDGTIKLWSKDKVKDLIRRSPDSFDGLKMGFFPITHPPALVSSDDEDTSKKSERVRTRLWH